MNHFLPTAAYSITSAIACFQTPMNANNRCRPILACGYIAALLQWHSRKLFFYGARQVSGGVFPWVKSPALICREGIDAPGGGIVECGEMHRPSWCADNIRNGDGHLYTAVHLRGGIPIDVCGLQPRHQCGQHSAGLGLCRPTECAVLQHFARGV